MRHQKMTGNHQVRLQVEGPHPGADQDERKPDHKRAETTARKGVLPGLGNVCRCLLHNAAEGEHQGGEGNNRKVELVGLPYNVLRLAAIIRRIAV